MELFNQMDASTIVVIVIFGLVLVGVAVKEAIDMYVKVKLWWYGFKKVKKAKSEDDIDYYSQL